MSDNSSEKYVNPYRSHPEQYLFADRDFKNGDWVVFIGLPDEEYQPGMISSPEEHLLYHCRGQVRIGPTEDIHVFPDEPNSNMLWVKFTDDKHPMRQIACTWIVKERDFTV